MLRTALIFWLLGVLLLFLPIRSRGQEVNITNAVAALSTTNPPAGFLKSLGVDGEFSGFAYLTSAPSLQHKFGGGVGILYHSATDSILGTEVRLQYLDIAKQEGQIWQPNAIETASKAFHFGNFYVEPIAETGVAMDSQCHPYMIIGAGGAAGWKQISVFGGVERWTGPYDSLTLYQFGVAWKFL